VGAAPALVPKGDVFENCGGLMRENVPSSARRKSRRALAHRLDQLEQQLHLVGALEERVAELEAEVEIELRVLQWIGEADLASSESSPSGERAWTPCRRPTPLSNTTRPVRLPRRMRGRLRPSASIGLPPPSASPCRRRFSQPAQSS
jgi:hypothetical protein